MAWACLAVKIDWPMKNAAKHAVRPTMKVTAANTSTLAARTTVRCGVAPSVARIWPVAYSELMTRTPRTPTASWARNRPLRLNPVGSNKRVSPRPSRSQRLTRAAQNSAPSPTTITTVTNSDHIVDLTVRSFVHSARHAATNTEPRPAPGGPPRSTCDARSVVAVILAVPPRCPPQQPDGLGTRSCLSSSP